MSHRSAALDSCSSTVSCCLNQRSNFFTTIIDGCLKYKNKEKPKTLPMPGPRLSYDMKFGLKPGPRGVNKSGPIGLKCRALISLAEDKTKGRKTHKQTTTEVSCGIGRQSITREETQSLLMSMSSRLKAVIACKGFSTKY